MPIKLAASVLWSAATGTVDVERIIAKHFPQSKTDTMRQRISPISIDAVYIQFTGSVQLEAKIRKLQERLSHKYPEGRIADIVEEGLDSLLEKIDRVAKPNKETTSKITRVILEEAGHQEEALDSRHVPTAVDREVRKRDEEQCSYISPSGHRCKAKRFLHIDHIKPWALGGSSHDVNNLRLLCSTHNQLRARETFFSPIAEFARWQKDYFAQLEKIRTEKDGHWDEQSTNKMKSLMRDSLFG